MAKILVVEDDQSLQRMYTMALTKSGFEVATAASGGEALVRVEEQTFDVILLDMLMGGMSGLDFLKTYDVRTRSPRTKVIALTNILNPAIEDQALKLGAVEYLYKADYDPVELIGHIQKLLSAPAPIEKVQ